MSHIIVLLREALQATQDRRMKKKINEIQYSLLEEAIFLVLKVAYYIEDEESERSNFK